MEHYYEGASKDKTCRKLVGRHSPYRNLSRLSRPKSGTKVWPLADEKLELRRVEAALRESEEKHRTLFENMTQGAFRQMADGVLVDVNPAALRMFGLMREEFLGRTSETPEWDVVHEDGSMILGNEHPSIVALRTGRPVLGEVVGIRNELTGKRIWVEINAIPEFHPGEDTPYEVVVTMHDVTERKRAEEKLKKNEERFRLLVENSPTAVFVHVEETIVSVNPAAVKLFGVSSADRLIGHRVLDWIHPDGRPIARKRMNRIKADPPESQPVIDQKYLRADGETVYVEAAAVPFVYSDRNAVAVFARDVTERKRAEAALIESANYSVAMAEIGRIINSSLDIEEVYERFAEEVQKIIPFDLISINLVNLKNNTIYIAYVAGAQIIPGRPKGAVFPLAGSFVEHILSIRKSLLIRTEEIKKYTERFPVTLPSFQAGFRSLIAVPLISKEEVIGVLYIRSTGEDSYAEKDLSVAERMGYYISSAVANARLYAEQKLAEKALKESEVRFRELTELLPQVVYETDLNGTMTYGNRYASETFGYLKKRSEGGINVLQSLVPEDRERAANKIRSVLRGNHSNFSGEYRALREDGTSFPVMIYSAPIIQEGNVVGSRGIVIDITERKLAEEERERLQSQLVQAQRLEAIGTLAGGIAHDFNNILSVILLGTDLSLLSIPEDSLARASLAEVHKGGERARELVKQILAFSRQGEQLKKQMNPASIVNEALKMLRSSIPSTIEIRKQVAKDCGTILADPTQVHQILMNLCVNAAHSMRKDGGVLRVDLGSAEIEEDGIGIAGLKPGRYVKLTVSDTGHGMDRRTMDRIFEPYFTTKPKGEGTGLGLAVVHGIVHTYGGGIKVESSPGEGATFEVFIPRVDRLSTKEEDVPATPIRGGTERILFVDDEIPIAELGAQVLRSLGYKVEVSTRGQDALEIFEAGPDLFDLVITDVTMPHMTGQELTRRMLHLRPDIPIILCTGFSEIVNQDEARRIGASAYVMKPLVIAQLAPIVRKVLNEKSTKRA